MSNPSTPNFFRFVQNHFVERFRQNGSIATIVFLAGACRNLAVGIKGPSNAGKSRLAHGVASLFPVDDVIFASRISGAALFALEKAGIVVNDECVNDSTFHKIRRMLISSGRAEGLLATSSGHVRHLRVEGPTAFIECLLDTSRQDFQDSSRAVLVRLSDSEDQFTYHAEQVCRSRTPNGLVDLQRWKQTEAFIKDELLTLQTKTPVVVDFDEKAITPPVIDAHSARRIEQVLTLAEGVSRVRQIAEEYSLLRISEFDVDDALTLLEAGRALDDHATINDQARGFLRAFASLAGGLKDDQATPPSSWEEISIEGLLHKLNADRFDSISKKIINWNKRHPRDDRATTTWTRSIITPRLNQLLDNNLIKKRWGAKGQLWKLTSDGAAFLECGSLRTYTLIRRQFDQWRRDRSG